MHCFLLDLKFCNIFSLLLFADFAFILQKLGVQELHEEESRGKPSPAEMCSSSLVLVMCIFSCIFVVECQICIVHDCKVLCLAVV